MIIKMSSDILFTLQIALKLTLRNRRDTPYGVKGIQQVEGTDFLWNFLVGLHQEKYIKQKKKLGSI